MPGGAVAVFLSFLEGYISGSESPFLTKKTENVIGLNQGHNASSVRKLSMKNWGLQVSRLINAMNSL